MGGSGTGLLFPRLINSISGRHLVVLRFQKRSALKFVSRIIPDAMQAGINDTSLFLGFRIRRQSAGSFSVLGFCFTFAVGKLLIPDHSFIG